MKKYNQLCVWPGTVMGDNTANDFEAFFKNKHHVRVKFMEETVTLASASRHEPGGRHDVLFYVHDDDIPRFAIIKLQYGIRWWEDIICGGGSYLYEHSILDKYPVQR